MWSTVTGKDAAISRLAQIFRVITALALGSVGLLSMTATPAAAHAVLLDSNPQDRQTLDEAPQSVELHFNEQVQPIDGAFQLFPSHGAPIELEAHAANHNIIIDLPADLDDDAYAVSWRVISADTHPLGGAISFQVGETTALPADIDGVDASSTSVRGVVWGLTALMYVGLLTMTGLVIFNQIVRRRLISESPDDRPIIWRMYLLATASALLLIPFTALDSIGRDITHILQPADWAPQVLWQPIATALVISLIGAVAVLLATRPGTIKQLASVIAALLAVSAPVLGGHPQTIHPAWLMIPADITHLIVGSFWVGGIIGLLRYLVSASPTTSAYHAIIVVNRFSTLALGSVLLLTISGGLMSLLILESPADLVATGHGKTLLVKLGLIGVVILLAAWNRIRLLPALEKHEADTDRWTSLHRILRYEATVLIGVLVISGLLTNQAPQHNTDSTAQVIDISVEAQGLTATGQLEPGLVGQNTLTFALTYAGEPLSPEEVTVEALLPAEDLGPFIDKPETSEQGDYVANIQTPVAGDWEIWIHVRVDKFSQPRVQIPVPIAHQ